MPQNRQMWRDLEKTFLLSIGWLKVEDMKKKICVGTYSLTIQTRFKTIATSMGRNRHDSILREIRSSAYTLFFLSRGNPHGLPPPVEGGGVC